MSGLSCVAVVVGANGFLRAGLGHILSAAHVRVVVSARDFSEITEDISKYKSLLLVIDAGDDLQTVAIQIKRFKKRQPHGRVAVIAEDCPLKSMVAVFLAGANACFQTDVGAKAFIKALELVMLGETILPPALLTYLKCLPLADEQLPAVVGPTLVVEEGPVQKEQPVQMEEPVQKEEPPQKEESSSRGLSTREWHILRYIAAGEANKVIARKMDIAEATVKVHVKAILRKIGVHNRTQAAIWAVNSPRIPETKPDW